MLLFLYPDESDSAATLIIMLRIYASVSNSDMMTETTDINLKLLSFLCFNDE